MVLEVFFEVFLVQVIFYFQWVLLKEIIDGKNFISCYKCFRIYELQYFGGYLGLCFFGIFEEMEFREGRCVFRVNSSFVWSCLYFRYL